MHNVALRFCQIACMFLALGLALPTASFATTVTLAPTKDNTMYSESASESNGAGDYLFAGRTSTDSLRRTLIAFPIAGNVPPCTNITGVRLKLHMSRTASGAQTFNLHRLSADWGEGTSNASGQEGGGAPATTGDATWHYAFFNTTAWASVGGDYAVAISGSQSVNAIGFYTWTDPQMIADVLFWRNNPGSNFGWIIIGGEATNKSAKRFDSRTNITAANRPVLEVDFDACGGVIEPPVTWGSIKGLYR